MTKTHGTSANPKVEAIRDDVRTSYSAIVGLIEGPLKQLAPAKLYQAPAEGEWSIMQNLAHIVEFMAYWGDEVVKLLANPGQNFGRIQQDERRLAAIRDHGMDTLEQVERALPGSYAHLDNILLEDLQDSDLQLTGKHTKFGEQTLEWFIEDFITRHLREHVQQIQEALRTI